MKPTKKARLTSVAPTAPVRAGPVGVGMVTEVSLEGDFWLVTNDPVKIGSPVLVTVMLEFLMPTDGKVPATTSVAITVMVTVMSLGHGGRETAL